MKCENCKKEHDGTYGSGRFCSTKCARGFSTKAKREEINEKVSATLSKNGKPTIKISDFCLNCGNKTRRRSYKFCSCKCKSDYEYKQYIQDWKNGKNNGTNSNGFSISKRIRRYLWEKYEGKCSRCGWNTPNPIIKKPFLEIEHIDGNCTNNKEENLTLLCPNCHSLTTTYKFLNVGNGNRKRYEYFGLGSRSIDGDATDF